MNRRCLTLMLLASLLCALLLSACCSSPLPPAAPPPSEAPPSQPAAAPASAAASDQAQAHPDAPPAVLLDGVPPLPAALRARLSQYLEVRHADFVGWDQQGTGLLIQTRFADVAQVHHVAQPLGARRQLSYYAEPVREASYVKGAADRSLLIYKDQGGDENYQLYRLELQSGQTQLLSDGSSRIGSYRWSGRGLLAYTSTARNGKDFDIYLMRQIAPGAGKRVLEVQGTFAPLDFSADDSRLLLQEYISINQTRLHLLELKSGQARLLTPADDKQVAYHDAVFAPGGQGLFVTSDRGGEFVTLYHLDLASGRFSPLTAAIPWNVGELELSPDGRTLAFTVNEEGYSRLYLLDTRSRRYRRAKLPDGLLWGLRFSPRQSATLGFSFMPPTGPADAYSLRLRGDALSRWTDSETGGLPRARFVAPELVRYPTFDQVDGQPRTIPAFYYRPAGQGPHPVIVVIHGGPEAQVQPYFNPQLQFWLAELGIAVLAPNVRGSDGYGKSYLLLDNGYKREDSVKDLGALLDWIGTRPELDARRVMVYGGSYGGYMVLAALVHYSARLKAGVDWVGISNFVTFLENTKDYRRDLRRAEYGDERDPKMRRFLSAISPLTRAQEINAPLLVIQGANDPRVPASESEQLVAAVRGQGQPVWYMLAQNEGHGFQKKVNRDLAQAITAFFVQRFLLAR